MLQIRKIQSLILALVLLAGWTAAVLVDDFEGYSEGVVNDVTGGVWIADSATTDTAVTIVDGTMQMTQATAQQHAAYCTAPDIADGTTATFFLRFKVSTLTTDSSIGLTDVTSPSTGASGTWTDFRAQIVLKSGYIQVRDGSTARNLVAINAGEWYNLWVIVNNVTGTSDTVQLYLNQDGDADAEDLLSTTVSSVLKDTFSFRTGTSGTLNKVYWRAQNTGEDRVISIDDIHIIEGVDLAIPPMNKPYNPSVTQTMNGDNINVVFSWNAAADPNAATTGNAVNPKITNQYVFVGISGDDPNLYYAGSTDADPGITDPASQFSKSLDYDTTYLWAVVEELDGFSETFTASSTLDDVDPNNIIGDVWSFDSLSSIPSITTEPVDVRVSTGDSAVFTVLFTSVNPVTATWYQDDVALTGTETGVTIDTGIYSDSTLTIDNASIDNEGKYYCILSVADGTADDIQTATRLLIIKKKLAEYNFNKTLENSSDENTAPTGVLKTVSLSDPNETKATVVDTLSYVAGVTDDPADYAIELSGNQFIDFGKDGYPQAGPLDTLGDIRGEGYEKTGFGRGMEQGTIVCWVKPTAYGAVYMNANSSDDTHFGLTTTSATTARMIMRGRNYDDSYQELGTAAGTVNMTNFSLQDDKWHMLAAKWQDSTMTLYVDGEQVATGTTGVPEIYYAWERANILGASRTSGARQMLNTFLTGAVDNLCVYNYVIDTADIIDEYMRLSLRTPCSNHSFTGSEYNFDNTESSYCKVDLGDFYMFASEWLDCGLYPECP